MKKLTPPRLALAVLAFALAAVASAANGAARPHLVLFLADDLSWADLSVYGSREIRTPNMERLAAGGMTFNRAFVVSPSCAPSRGALLTGLNPVRSGAMYNHQPPKPALKKWPAYFQELGYEVVAIGKVAHYAQVKLYGFDHYSHFTYHEDTCIDEAVRWLGARRSDKPLCLLVGTNWSHVPWPEKGALDPAKAMLPSMLVDTPETRAAWTRYAAAVERADRDLGKVYEAVQRYLGRDTFFAFTSDHGAQWPFHKWNCYDAGLRTPLVVAWPGHARAGARTDAMVSWIDLLPTLLEAAGGTPPPAGTGDGAIDGRSFAGVLRGERDTHRDAIFATHSGDGRMNEFPMRAVRTGRWKYIRNLDPGREFHSHVDGAPKGEGYWSSWPAKAKHDEAARAVVDHYFHRPAEELFDIEADPFEQHNLVTDRAHAATLAELRRRLDAWMSAQGDAGLATERAHKPPIPPGQRASRKKSKQ